MSKLYHTYPLQCLSSIRSGDPVFIESEPLFNSPPYEEFFTTGICPTNNLILDCGVGASPNLDDPTAHVSADPHWGIWYLMMCLNIRPQVIVVPDILGNGLATRVNFKRYLYIISRLMDFDARPELMYVIQGQTKEQAYEEIEFACVRRSVSWVGFPRLVHYWGDYKNADDLAEIRMEFVSSVITKLRDSGKKIHLLGMNNTKELRFAAANEINCDTRLASLAGIHNLNILKTRPPGLKIDLTQTFTVEQIKAIIENKQLLNIIYKNEPKNT